MKKLYILSAQLVKAGSQMPNSMLGHRVAGSEEEAVGMFFKSVLKTMPGFNVQDILCKEIPAEELREILESGDRG